MMIKMVNIQKSVGLLVIMLLYWHCTMAQQSHTLSLDHCFERAKQHYPLIKQFTLIEKAKEYTIANAQKAYLPQLNIAGQASYQSAVTQIPIRLPNVAIPTMSQDQYKLYGEVAQSITDLFTVKYQAEYIKANAEIELQNTTVELYKLRERINNLFFGILLMDEQVKQNELLKKDIQSGIDKTNVSIANGVALKSTADNLRAELWQAEQRSIELQSTRKGYAAMLALFINSPIDDNTVLAKPPRQMLRNSINRPELKVFDLQQQSFHVQQKLITAKNLPRLTAFFQGGLGKPGLNMLDNAFQAYYIGGLRLSWNITSFYTYKNELRMLVNSQNRVDMQRETFLFNTQLSLTMQNAAISKMQELIEADKRIIPLRESVKNTTQNQLSYGTATTNDYLLAVNAVDQARLSLILHEIQLLMTEYNMRTTTGN